MRAIQCPGCNQERDRDHNGATNMALAALCLLNNEAWPVELQLARKALCGTEYSTSYVVYVVFLLAFDLKI